MLDLSEDETRMETVIKKCDRIFGLPCVGDYDIRSNSLMKIRKTSSKVFKSQEMVFGKET